MDVTDLIPREMEDFDEIEQFLEESQNADSAVTLTTVENGETTQTVVVPETMKADNEVPLTKRKKALKKLEQIQSAVSALEKAQSALEKALESEKVKFGKSLSKMLTAIDILKEELS